MTKVVPSQVVAFIDSIYPQARKTPAMPAYSADAAVLATIIDLANEIPVELLTISGDDYTGYIFGLGSMRAAIGRWNYRGGDDPPRTYDGKSAVYLVREALRKCPDQNPSPQTTDLNFIADQPLRDSIRLDMSSASNALHRNDFKAATVLAGSATEALLLWAIQANGINAPLKGMITSPNGRPENWNLGQYIEAAEMLKLLKQDSAIQAKQAKDFRNLIHPGRAQRAAANCDRGTALGALSAVELVVRDLTP